MHPSVFICGKLNQDPVAMVYLMLDDLCRPAGEGFDAGPEISGLPPDLDRLPPFARARTAKQGETPFFRILFGNIILIYYIKFLFDML